MLSRIIPLEYLKERDLMFWLPPGGQDNEVWADTWVILAELESTDVAPVLDLLHRNDIGGYVASPSGRKGAPSAGRQLYVDREQLSRATDVLMLFLRKKNQPATSRAPRKPAPASPKVKPRGIRILVMALKIACVAALIGLGVLLAYYKGSQFVSHMKHTSHTTPANPPGITAPKP